MKLMSITLYVSPLRLGKPRHDTPCCSFLMRFRKTPACMTSEGLLPPPPRLSEPASPSASQESSSGSSAASGFVLRPAAPAPFSRTFLRKVQLAKVWLSLLSPPTFSLVPDVQEAPSQETRWEVQADAAEESGGRGASAAGGEQAGPFAFRKLGRRDWGGRLGPPGLRKVAAGGRPDEERGAGRGRDAGGLTRCSRATPGEPAGGSWRCRAAVLGREPPCGARTPGAPRSAGGRHGLARPRCHRC